MSSKRVLVLVPHSVTEDNGITIRSKAVCAVLQHNYHVTTRSSRTPYAANALVTIAGFVAWMLKLLFLIPLQRVDCVYCCADYFGFVSAYILSKALGFRVLFEAHGILSEENIAKKRPATLVRACSVIERFVISRADYVVALSGDVVEFYKKYNAHIELIPVFLDERRYQKRQSGARDVKNIGLIGPFDMPANKYYMEFLYKHVDEFDPRIRFRVIGKCDWKIANDRITYTDYISSRDTYLAELSLLDALLVPANVSTSGPLNKILEAMATSLPVFATPASLNGLDYAEDGKNLVVADPNELVVRVNRVVFDQALSSQLGLNARRLVEKRYSRAANSVKLMAIIDSLW